MVSLYFSKLHDNSMYYIKENIQYTLCASIIHLIALSTSSTDLTKFFAVAGYSVQHINLIYWQPPVGKFCFPVISYYEIYSVQIS